MAFANNNADASEEGPERSVCPPRSNDVLKMLHSAGTDADADGLLDALLTGLRGSDQQSDDAQQKKNADDAAKEEDDRVLMAGVRILQARRGLKQAHKQAEQAEKATTKAGEAADEAKAKANPELSALLGAQMKGLDQVEEEKADGPESANVAVQSKKKEPNIIYNEADVLLQKAAAEQKAEDNAIAMRDIVSNISKAPILAKPAEEVTRPISTKEMHVWSSDEHKNAPVRIQFRWNTGYGRFVNFAWGCPLAFDDPNRDGHSQWWDKPEASPPDLRWQPRLRSLNELIGGPAWFGRHEFGIEHLGQWMASFAGAGPNHRQDGHGSIYVLKRASYNGRLKKDLLFKIGYTRRQDVVERVAELATANGESYQVIAQVPSAFPRFMEYQLHRFFQPVRVSKFDGTTGKLSKGGSEWLLYQEERIKAVVVRVKALMLLVWGDRD